MKNLKLKSGMALVACLGLSANAMAATCDDLIWNENALPSAEEACLEVVERDGATFAKLTAQVVTQANFRTAYRWILPDGSQSDRYMVDKDNEGFRTMIDGRPVRIADLPEGQQVNVYLGDMYWSLPEAEPMAVAAAPEPEPEPMAEPEPMPEPEPAPVMLPKTGSQLNWLAVLGSMLVLLGGALRFTRS